MRTSIPVFVAVGLLGLAGCNKAERRYPTISVLSPDGGGINVHGSYNRCPQVIYVATPDHVPVGRPISLTAIATDADNHSLTYAWTATSGSFASADTPTTTFECASNGAVTITLTVSDGSCPSAVSGVVLCQPSDGGVPDGGSDARGDADGPGGGGGQPGTGGGSGVAGMGGAGGMAGGGSGGTGTGIGGSSGSTGSGGKGGSSTTGTAGTAGSTGAAGSGACIETNPPADIAVVCNECLDLNQNPVTDGCCNIANDPLGVQLCQAASACMRAGRVEGAPCNNMGDTGTCYCGTSGMTCSSGGANGPCTQQITAAAARNVVTRTTDTPTPAQIIQRYGSPDFALGRAGNIQTVAGAFCPAECGF
jgi:hypothetical protein